MIQFTTHLWFGNEKTTLIATIDDATSDIPGGSFFPSETTVHDVYAFGGSRALNGINRK